MKWIQPCDHHSNQEKTIASSAGILFRVPVGHSLPKETPCFFPQSIVPVFELYVNAIIQHVLFLCLLRFLCIMGGKSNWALLIRRPSFPSRPCSVLFVKSSERVCVGCISEIVSLVCFSILVPTFYCFNYYSCVLNLDIWLYISFSCVIHQDTSHS